MARARANRDITVPTSGEVCGSCHIGISSATDSSCA